MWFSSIYNCSVGIGPAPIPMLLKGAETAGYNIGWAGFQIWLSGLFRSAGKVGVIGLSFGYYRMVCGIGTASYMLYRHGRYVWVSAIVWFASPEGMLRAPTLCRCQVILANAYMASFIPTLWQIRIYWTIIQ